MKNLIVLYGPTGVGKTSVSIALAEALSAPIVSSDSRQVFKEMSIGTAVPSNAELQQIKHYFIHNRSIKDGFSAGDFEKEALVLLEKLFQTSKNVLLVGGSNLYINALLYGLDDLPRDDKIRVKLNLLTLSELQNLLRNLDPKYYEEVDLSNIARVKRAVEVSQITGKPYSESRKGEIQTRNFDIIKIGLTRNRDELYDRINKRVDDMVLAGLENEARTLYQYKELPAMQTVGYREWFEYFGGRISKEEAINLIKQHTRNYAKRQLTWLRRDDEIKWFSPEDTSAIIDYLGSL